MLTHGVGLQPWFNALMTSSQPWWLTMPPAEVAATIVPFFSHQTSDEQLAIEKIVAWCKTGKDKARWLHGNGREQFDDPDYRAIAEAMQVLEHAGLLMRSSRLRRSEQSSGGFWVGLTRLGMHAIATNTVRQHLGLGDAPPRPESN
jgi:hypothetical protein